MLTVFGGLLLAMLLAPLDSTSVATALPTVVGELGGFDHPGVLCGIASSMTRLIIFRAIQGLGGGGLMVTAQAVVGDIVTPRERGRYQGIFGAVFGVSSVAGPPRGALRYGLTGGPWMMWAPPHSYRTGPSQRAGPRPVSPGPAL